MANNTLHLNLKGEYFDQIVVRTEYWRQRLQGRSYQRVLVKKGYPRAGDRDRIVERPWRGYEEQTITHPHFGPGPVEVFAIRVN